jgi:hypothetical protein
MKPLIALWAFASIRRVEMRATRAALKIPTAHLDRLRIPIYHDTEFLCYIKAFTVRRF